MDEAEFEAMTTAAERAEMREEDQSLVPPDEWNESRGFISMATDDDEENLAVDFGEGVE